MYPGVLTNSVTFVLSLSTLRWLLFGHRYHAKNDCVIGATHSLDHF